MIKVRVFSGICIALIAFGTLAGNFPAQASNDPLLPQQWGLAKIQAEQAWAASRGNGVLVAVIDTGIDFGHEELGGKSAGAFNCIKESPVDDPCDPVPDGDDNGHGTEVSGIIAAAEGNSVGIAGVAPGARIMSVKALDANGSGDLSNVLRGIYFSADKGARVINLSLGPEVNLINDLLGLLLGGGNPRQEFQQAFDYAASKGALVVAAAGNSGTSSFFSGLQNVFVAGATGPGDEVAFYSSSGAEIFAPGGNANGPCSPANCILSTSPGGYKAVQGTSFAAPHVAGVAALLVAQGLSSGDARSRMVQTSDPIPGGSRLNAFRAVGGGTAAQQAPKPSGATDASGKANGAPRQPKAPPAVVPTAQAPVTPPASEPSVVPVLELRGSGLSSNSKNQKLIVAGTTRKTVGPVWGVVAAALAGIIALGNVFYFILRRQRI